MFLQCFPQLLLVEEPKQENIGQSDAGLIGRLEEGAGQAMFRARVAFPIWMFRYAKTLLLGCFAMQKLSYLNV